MRCFLSERVGLFSFFLLFLFVVFLGCNVVVVVWRYNVLTNDDEREDTAPGSEGMFGNEGGK